MGKVPYTPNSTRYTWRILSISGFIHVFIHVQVFLYHFFPGLPVYIHPDRLASLGFGTTKLAACHPSSFSLFAAPMLAVAHMSGLRDPFGFSNSSLLTDAWMSGCESCDMTQDWFLIMFMCGMPWGLVCTRSSPSCCIYSAKVKLSQRCRSLFWWSCWECSLCMKLSMHGSVGASVLLKSGPS